MVIFTVHHPENQTYCEGSNVLLSCVIFDNTSSYHANNTFWSNRNVGAPITTSINNTRKGYFVTSVLTIENVSLNANGSQYFCVPSTLATGSYVGVLSVAGIINI